MSTWPESSAGPIPVGSEGGLSVSAMLQVAPPVPPPVQGLSLGWVIAYSIAGSAAATAVVNAGLAFLQARAQRLWEIRKRETERADRRTEKARRRMVKDVEPLLMSLERFVFFFNQELLHHRGHIVPTLEDEFRLLQQVEHARLLVTNEKLRGLFGQISEQYREFKPLPADPEEREKMIRERQQVFKDALSEGIRHFKDLYDKLGETKK